MVGQLSASSNVSNSSYCSMAMRVATFADHWIIWADQMRIKSSEHLIRMRCERCQREVEFQRSCAARARPGEFTQAFGPHALRHTSSTRLPRPEGHQARPEGVHLGPGARHRGDVEHRGLSSGKPRRPRLQHGAASVVAKKPAAGTQGARIEEHRRGHQPQLSLPVALRPALRSQYRGQLLQAE